MASKVVWYRDAWWVRTRWGGNKKKDRRIGTTKANKREATAIAKQINKALALGAFELDKKADKPIPFDTHIRDWHRRYSVTFKPRYQETSLSILDNHLIPFFGNRDLRSIKEADLLDYIGAKIEDGQKSSTIQNALSIVRRILNLAIKDGLLTHNPANGIGRLISRVARSEDEEVPQVSSWTQSEVLTLLQVAENREPRFAPLLRFLLSTGARRSEALGLEWQDVNFDQSRVTIRRALTKGIAVTTKSGKARTISMPAGLTSALFDLLADRRKECLNRGWPEVPAQVFCSESGTPLDENNVGRTWRRLMRFAQKKGVRPLRLHDCRHTYATLALEAGRSIRFVAEQLGHANPEMTLRQYAHALPLESGDLNFADFDTEKTGSKRLYPAPTSDAVPETKNAPGTSGRERYENLERETGFEPATLSLGS